MSRLMRKMGQLCQDDSAIIEMPAKEISILKHEHEELRSKKRKKKTYLTATLSFLKVPAMKKAPEAMLKIIQSRRTAMRVSKIKQADLEHTFHINLH